ncbi:hypothetical protein WICPIJ_006120 [Wickerhamomyces pijperi]|uniref:Mevalonate kinase n=1 Tax=Wickerhamomyces pijperi TaxID=599730 RepID=A0A9P8Q4A8_WICPI|nr:hypothetical protein WICPIJ_006120 [Wickerhamomyces pijperi]
MTTDSSFVVSSPGKVIIFGEHSAVYAIAAAVSLRTYLLVSPSSDAEDIVLEFPDINLTHTWKRSSLPWEAISKFINQDQPQTTEELIPEVVNELANTLSDMKQAIHFAAANSFLYLYVNLLKRDTPGMRFTVRSTLPIGAGLGSSASISVCLASAFSIVGGHVSAATLTKDDLSTEGEDSEFIDAWSFMGEKCIHGNPSGIDNAVATHGGAVMFQRTQSSIPSIRTNMRNFPSLKLLLTNTKQPRRTSDLVGNVSRLSTEYPKTTESILNAMDHLTREGYQLMIRPSLDEKDKARLRELFEINHGLLVALGVSHPVLEKVRILTDELNIGKTKLTGAGGGGCAITLVNDNVEESLIKSLIEKYSEYGFETYETSLGGKGAAYLALTQQDSVEFNSEKFLELTEREEIENAIGVSCKDGWRFW